MLAGAGDAVAFVQPLLARLCAKIASTISRRKLPSQTFLRTQHGLPKRPHSSRGVSSPKHFLSLYAETDALGEKDLEIVAVNRVRASNAVRPSQ